MKSTLAFACALAVSAFPTVALDQVLIIYGDLDVPHFVDSAPAGPSLGDSYVRHGFKRASSDGPMIGEYFSQATIVFLDPATETSAGFSRKVGSEQRLRSTASRITSGERSTTKRNGQRKVIVTDKLRSCGARLKDLGMPDDVKPVAG